MHDGYELARQDKITGLLAPQVRAQGHTLAVCFRGGPSGRANCGSCEKCLRTGVGLALGGVEPADAGIDMTVEDLDRWRARVMSGFYSDKPLTLCDWRDLQVTLAAGHGDVPPPLRSFLEWLATVDFDSIPPQPFWSRSRRRTGLRRWRARVVETLPPPVQRLRETRRRLGAARRRRVAGAGAVGTVASSSSDASGDDYGKLPVSQAVTTSPGER